MRGLILFIFKREATLSATFTVIVHKN
jgi:hypothetical protein